jgi:hypothetical protein
MGSDPIDTSRKGRGWYADEAKTEVRGESDQGDAVNSLTVATLCDTTGQSGLSGHICRLFPCNGCFSTLKTEVISSSETSVYIRNILRYIPENDNRYKYRFENPKS